MEARSGEAAAEYGRRRLTLIRCYLVDDRP
jgi:hypothetical protein